MAFPFAKGSSPGQRAAGREEGDAPKKKGPSVDSALSVLEDAAKTPRAHSALKTLRQELSGSGDEKQDKPDSPGARAAGRFNFDK